ncbi:MAG TPA: ATPase domain-containing protein [Longimicrobiaceae bacterium]|nr:ATPase domain-containing protein [Longimicrobiaceae bacterium]
MARTNAGDRSGPLGPEQVPTGVPGLDRLLSGGLRRGSLHVVLGGPGAGKSVLAHQIGAGMIRMGGKVLYLTGLVETHQTLITQARTFRFFDPAFVPGAFYYAGLYPTLAGGGLEGAGEEIRRLVVHHAPSLVILDGVHALKDAARDRLDYQRFMHGLEAQAAVGGVTTLLLAHPPEGGIASDPTFTIADAIFEMGTEEVRLRQVRMFSVVKLRGVAHVSGRHAFRITAEGIEIYPRMEAIVTSAATVSDSPPQDASDEMLDLQVDGLAGMLGGGLARDSVTLMVGTPGSGKTLLGISFLTAGAEAGEPGLFFGYHEAPQALLQKAAAVDLPLRRHIEEGRIHLYWRIPTELLADQEMQRLLEMVERHGIRRVVIDALEDVRQAVIPRERELTFLSGLTHRLREARVSTILMQDLERIVGLNFDLPMAELSAMLDNVLHLRYVEQKGELKRLISVLKVRAREHDHRLRELQISGKGLKVGKPYDRQELVLTGLGISR